MQKNEGKQFIQQKRKDKAADRIDQLILYKLCGCPPVQAVLLIDFKAPVPVQRNTDEQRNHSHQEYGDCDRKINVSVRPVFNQKKKRCQDHHAVQQEAPPLPDQMRNPQIMLMSDKRLPALFGIYVTYFFRQRFLTFPVNDPQFPRIIDNRQKCRKQKQNS